MSLRIDASNLVTRRYLAVRSDGLIFCDGAVSNERRHRFADIVCVLLSPDNTLSFQVGQEVFSLPVKPDDRKHQETMNTLVQEIKRASGNWEPPA
jgi:hypothetical protein